MIEVRKLAAIDMAWLGTRLIVTEYALGIILPAALGILSLLAGLAQPEKANWQTMLGIWLMTISANYVPLFVYAGLGNQPICGIGNRSPIQRCQTGSSRSTAAFALGP